MISREAARALQRELSGVPQDLKWNASRGSKLNTAVVEANSAMSRSGNALCLEGLSLSCQFPPGTIPRVYWSHMRGWVVGLTVASPGPLNYQGPHVHGEGASDTIPEAIAQAYEALIAAITAERARGAALREATRPKPPAVPVPQLSLDDLDL